MDDRGQFTAALLDSGTRAYAAGAVARLQEDPASQGLLDAFGFASLVADSEVRLQSLAEALAAGRPELFQHDVKWLEATYEARRVPTELIRLVLEALLAELEESLPPDSTEEVRRCFEVALGGLGKTTCRTETLLVDGSPHVELARRFLLALLEGKRQAAVELVLEALEEGVPLLDLHQHVITRAQAEVGRMWQTGELHVAEEHLSSRIVEEALVVLRRRIPREAATGKTVIVASVPGNLHDIGARVVSDHFEIAGWDSVFLGADTPTNSLVRAIGDFGADLVALSSGLGMNVRSTAEAVDAIHAASDVPVIVGGVPFLVVAELWKDVGADGTAPDPAEAVKVAEKLTK